VAAEVINTIYPNQAFLSSDTIEITMNAYRQPNSPCSSLLVPACRLEAWLRIGIYVACFRAKGYIVQTQEERERVLPEEERVNRERLVQQSERERRLQEEAIQKERLAETRRVDEEKLQQTQETPKSYVYLSGYTEEDVPMVLIPEGEFLFETDNARTWLPAFYIGTYEVTTQLYASFMKATNHSKPEHWGDVRPDFDGTSPSLASSGQMPMTQ